MAKEVVDITIRDNTYFSIRDGVSYSCMIKSGAENYTELSGEADPASYDKDDIAILNRDKIYRDNNEDKDQSVFAENIVFANDITSNGAHSVN